MMVWIVDRWGGPDRNPPSSNAQEGQWWFNASVFEVKKEITAYFSGRACRHPSLSGA